jgi:hypothetical protein
LKGTDVALYVSHTCEYSRLTGGKALLGRHKKTELHEARLRRDETRNSKGIHRARGRTIRIGTKDAPEIVQSVGDVLSARIVRSEPRHALIRTDRGIAITQRRRHLDLQIGSLAGVARVETEHTRANGRSAAARSGFDDDLKSGACTALVNGSTIVVVARRRENGSVSADDTEEDDFGPLGGKLL